MLNRSVNAHGHPQIPPWNSPAEAIQGPVRLGGIVEGIVAEIWQPARVARRGLMEKERLYHPWEEGIHARDSCI
jgi:hypothetical protein